MRARPPLAPVPARKGTSAPAATPKRVTREAPYLNWGESAALAASLRRQCRGDCRLELDEAKRLQQVRHRPESARLLGRRQDARADDREILEPAPEPGCRCQAGRRGRLEDHHRGRFATGQLAMAYRLVTGSPDDRL